jgi:hypothetical protein
MMERAAYYIDLLISLCGFNGSDDSVYFGWCVVLLSTGIVIFAFYEGINKMIWPGEKDRAHTKYRIFDESELTAIEVEERDDAH